MRCQRATVPVPQGSVRHSGVRAKAGVSRKGRGAKAAPSLCAPSFLTSVIEPIRTEDSYAEGRFGISLDKSYARILGCCKRFLKIAGIEFDYVAKEKVSKSQRIGELIDYFEKKIKPLGLSLMISKKDCQGVGVKVLESVVYRLGSELEDTILVFYCSPAWYLSPEGSKMYKRFMKFVSDSTNIPLGIPEHTENFYLDMIVNSYEDEDFDNYFDEDEKEERSEQQHIVERYKQDGEFWNLFDEINCLPAESAEELTNALEEYRKVCPDNEMELIESMIEGVPIMKDANCYWFEFNPDDDGVADDYGNDGIDGYSSSVFASAILFSEYDGVADALIENVNCEVQSGIMMTGWNIHQWLSPGMKKADILDFLRCKDLVASIDKWIRVFCQEAGKFDLYGKSNRDAK